MADAANVTVDVDDAFRRTATLSITIHAIRTRRLVWRLTAFGWLVKAAAFLTGLKVGEIGVTTEEG